MEQDKTREKNSTSTESNWKAFFTTSNCVYIYSAIIIVLMGIALFRSFVFFNLCIKSSIKLHNNMFSKIVYAYMFFFNTNPSGRILNRFSKDMGTVDESLPMSLNDALQVSSFDVLNVEQLVVVCYVSANIHH